MYPVQYIYKLHTRMYSYILLYFISAGRNLVRIGRYAAECTLHTSPIGVSGAESLVAALELLAATSTRAMIASASYPDPSLVCCSMYCSQCTAAS